MSEEFTRIKAANSHWQDFLLLSKITDQVIHQASGNTGRYQYRNGTLAVMWDRFGPENFISVSEQHLQKVTVGRTPSLGDLTMLRAGDDLFRVSRVTILLPETGFEITLRIGTSDVPTFEQIFVVREYASRNLPVTAETIVDIGANIGLASIYFGLKYPTARILSMEPDADNFALLQVNTAKLPVPPSCENAALWKFDGEIALHRHDESGAPLGAWGLRVSEDERAADSKTRCVRLDSLLTLARFDHIDILKIDIEGAELEVFSSSPETWLDKVSLIIIETHDRFRAGSEQAVRQALASRFEELPAVGENLFFRRV